MTQRIFDEKLPRSEKHDRFIEDMATRAWKFALAALYLSSGRCIPEEAKRPVAFFGYCDAEGRHVPKAEATHVGWTIAPPPEPQISMQ